MKLRDIIIKDLRVMLKDKKALAIMIAMPIILTTILGGALGSSFNESNIGKTQIGIVKKYDIDSNYNSFISAITSDSFSSSISESQLEEIKDGVKELNIDEIFTSDFLENEDVKKIIDYKIVDEESAMELLQKGEISAAVILPEDFIYDMYINFFTPFRNSVEIKVIGHPDKYIGSQIAEGVVGGFTDIISTMVISKNVFLEAAMGENMGQEAFDSMGEIVEEMSNDIEKSNVIIDYIKVDGREPISSFQYYSAAMAAMFILFTASEGGKLLLEERDNMTYQRMVVAGISKGKIIVGKFLTVFTYGLIQIIAMIGFSTLVLKVYWGDIRLVALISIGTVFTIAALSTLISALTLRAGNYKAADLFQSILIHVFSFLGGSFIPIDVLPDFISRLGTFTPNGLALKSYQMVMIGEGLNQILNFLLQLIAMGVVFTLIGIYILNFGEVWKHDKHTKIKTAKIEG